MVPMLHDSASLYDWYDKPYAAWYGRSTIPSNLHPKTLPLTGTAWSPILAVDGGSLHSRIYTKCSSAHSDTVQVKKPPSSSRPGLKGLMLRFVSLARYTHAHRRTNVGPRLFRSDFYGVRQKNDGARGRNGFRNMRCHQHAYSFETRSHYEFCWDSSTHPEYTRASLPRRSKTFLPKSSSSSPTETYLLRRVGLLCAPCHPFSLL